MLLLVRHGRTAANASGLLIGRLDPPLDAEGVRQAEAVGRAMAVEAANCKRVIASPLDRTRKTAEKIAAGLGVEVELDDRWIELDYGTLDGLRLGDVPAEVWSAWRADPAHVPGGGESLLALGRRVQQAAEALLPSIEGGDVVVVSHVSPIKAAVAWALGVGDEVSWRMFLSPASITRIACRGGAPTLVSFNDTSALS